MGLARATCWLLSLVLCWGLPSPHTTLSYAAVYYVTPHTHNPDCPSEEPCHTINEYAQGNYFDGDESITLLFLNGEHDLSAQNFELDSKKSLVMAPSHISHIQAEVAVYISNEKHVKANNISVVRVSALNFHSKNANNDHSTPDCLVFSDLDLLSLTSISIESCLLSVHGEMNATIIELVVGKSHVNFRLNNSKQSVAIKSSEFYSSILSINDSHSDHAFIDNSIESWSSFLLENSTMNNSLFSVNLQTLSVYELSFLYTSIASQANGKLKTGINIGIQNTVVLHMFMENCNVVGNHYGVHVVPEGESTLQLNIDQCFIADNGLLHEILLPGHLTGGVLVYSLTGNSKKNTTISSTILSGNKFAQIGFNSQGTTVVTVFNSTLRGSSGLSSQDILRFGAFLQVGQHGPNYNYMSVYFSNSCIEHTDIGINIWQGSYNQYEVTVVETVIKQSQHGILAGSLLYQETVNGSITVKDTCFKENSGISLGVEILQPDSSKGLDIILNNVTFFNNTNVLPNSGIVQVDRSIALSIEDSCVFRGNQGTPIQALATTVTLSGEVIFEDNVAFQGGAISLSYSTLRLKSVDNSSVNVLFVNNTATNTGGGIYIDRSKKIDSDTRSSCFYALEGLSGNDILRSIINVSLVFRDNEATNGGIDIYGGTPSSECLITSHYTSSQIKDFIFKTSANLSAISSDPKRVCLCDSFLQLMCANLSHIFYNTTRYPGEVFSIYSAVVGFEFGTVTGPVYANLLPQPNNSMSLLGNGQHVRQVDYNGCTQLKFTVNSHNLMETIVLTVNSTVITKVDNSISISQAIDSYLYSNVVPFPLLVVPVYINVTLLDCPPGFVLTGTGRCDCISALKGIGIYSCSIYDTTPYVTHNGNQWIQLSNNSDSILTSKYCPFDYCKRETINVNLNNPDEQCALSHIGTLCGACPSNLSLAIGSSRCLECPNNYGTLLLITFVAAGVLLVLFIKILDLTVSKGTINGLILYANIIWANQSVLFPPQEQTSPLLQFLKVFIAWLNLDFGIETCFIQGLNGYWKTWLQFVFPAYIWLIAGLIILVSHYSTRATKVIGNNSVSVLATLFLLAYAKLLRTILVILDFTVLKEYPNHQRLIKWSLDGRLPYLGLEHSFLFVVAVVVVLVLWLPYTFVLLFIRPLRRHTHHRFLRWINKLSPFFDSYLGPLKDKHHYWLGLGLLARLVLLLTSVLTLTTVPFISAAVLIVTVSILLPLVLSVYKQWQLGVLEGCFLVNMVLFSSSATVIELQAGNKDPLACTSLGITFILFLAIIGYHMYRRCYSLMKQRKSTNGYLALNCGNETLSQVPSSQKVPTTSQVDLKYELRESILDFSPQ